VRRLDKTGSVSDLGSGEEIDDWNPSAAGTYYFYWYKKEKIVRIMYQKKTETSKPKKPLLELTISDKAYTETDDNKTKENILNSMVHGTNSWGEETLTIRKTNGEETFKLRSGKIQ
jgi:hypothetical protein